MLLGWLLGVVPCIIVVVVRLRKVKGLFSRPLSAVECSNVGVVGEGLLNRLVNGLLRIVVCSVIINKRLRIALTYQHHSRRRWRGLPTRLTSFLKISRTVFPVRLISLSIRERRLGTSVFC